MKPNQIALALLAAVVGIGALLSVIISQNPVTHIATVAPQTQVAQVVQSITMGETNSTLSQQDDNGDANSLIAVQTSLSQTATIQSLSFYVTTASGKLRLGIYDATGSGGGPGAKVAETNEITPVKGWNMASVVTPRSLNAGTYWITYLTNDNNLYFPWSTSGSYRSAGVTYGAMPATYPSSARSGSGHAALYATLNFTTTPSNTGTPSTPAAPTYPPQISGVAVPTVTPTSATITWSTNIPADTQVYYGTTDAKFDYARYSSHTNLDTTLSTSHSVTLTGLIANTMYFFQVRSSANSKTGTIAQQFTTSPANTTVTPTINTFTISPSPAVRGQQATLSWTTTGLVSCTIESTGNTYIQQIFGSTLGVVKLPNDNITVNIPASVGILNRGTTSTVQLGCYTEPFTLDGAGHISKVNGTYIYKTVSVTIPAASTVVGDVLPPSVPTNLRVTSVTSSQVNLSWDASTDNAGGTGLQGYQIYRNGSFYTNTNTTTTFLNTSLNASTLYTYTVAAYDNATPTNVSAQSSSVSTTTPRAVDIGNPSVTAFTIPATSNSLTISPISITATDDTGVAGYMITTTAGAPLSTASGWTTTAPTSYTVAAAGASTLYAWAKDAAGNVSLSRSASVTVTLTSTPTATLSANPTTITSGNSSTLTWSSTNATSCTGTGGTFAGTKATSGTTSVSPTVTTTYGISCTGTGGTSATMNATVTVGTVGTTYTWYVDSTATGSNNGTSWANAWTSLSSASGASVVAGDIVYISGGPAGSTRTYSGAWTPKSGTSSGRITYQIGQDSQHNGTAIFSGSGTWLTNPAYVNIIGDAGDGNMHFQTSGYSMILSADSSASQSYRIGYTNFGTMTSGNYGRLVQVSAGSNVEFDHNWLKSSAGAGSDIVFYWTAPGSAAYDSALKFHHNTLYAPFSSQGLGQDGMRIDGVSGVSIYNNLFSGYSYSGSTEHQDGIQDWTYGSYIKIYNNTFLDFANAGINISAYYGGYSHVRIYNNIISFTNSVASAGSEGGFIGIAAGGFTMNDCIVANNLIAGGSQGWSMNDSGNYGATWTNSLIENNISVQGAGVQADTAHGVVSSNNIDNMSLSTAQSYFTNYVSTLNGTNNNFHLKSGATNLIGKGTNLTSYGITTDFDGNPRPATGAWDIGPFQYTGSVTPTTYTLTATAGSNGTISPSGATTVASGGGQTYTINPSAGFQVASVLVDSVSVGAVTTYTFTNVVANHTISATFSAVVSTGNWYVKPNGTGGGTSWTDAASVTSIWSKNIQPGNTIWLAGGTTYTSGLTVSKSGNANSRIYVKRVRASDAVAVASPGWSSGYDSQVVFSLSSGDTIQINGSYVTVDGQVANGIKVNVPNVSGTPDGVAFSGTTGSVIANAEMSGPGMTASFAGYVEGLASYSGNGNMATNVYIHGFNQNISLYNDNGFVFDHCRIADNGSANVDTGHPNLIEYNSSRNMVMRYSVVENWTVVGLMMWNGGNGVSGAVTLYGNVFKNASQDLIWASGTGGANKGPVYLYNNTFINTAVSMGRENTVVLDTASRARNNIYWNISLWCGPWYATPGITNAGIIVDRDYEFASSATQAGNPSGGHNILNGSNPFVNYNGGDYHIVGTVGATYPKDKGVAVTNASGQTYDVDPDGTTRPSGAWDIGAYEYH